MAGLPDIGASQSYRRCSQLPEDAHAWPTSRHRIFRIIEQAWRDRADRLKETFLARLQKRARAIRATDDKGMPDHASGVARQFFFKSWWYLEQAINEIDIERASIGMLCHSSSRAIGIDVWRKRHQLLACSPRGDRCYVSIVSESFSPQVVAVGLLMRSSAASGISTPIRVPTAGLIARKRRSFEKTGA